MSSIVSLALKKYRLHLSAIKWTLDTIGIIALEVAIFFLIVGPLAIIYLRRDWNRTRRKSYSILHQREPRLKAIDKILAYLANHQEKLAATAPCVRF
jgi:hypothetical protein